MFLGDQTRVQGLISALGDQDSGVSCTSQLIKVILSTNM
jgi:hypothetical protein